MKLLDDEALSNVTRFVKFYIIRAHSPLKWFLMIGLTFASMKSAINDNFPVVELLSI